MAYYFLYPEKDTTIYSHPYRQDLNTGIVETLSLASEKGNTNDLYYPSRILLKFKDSELKDVIKTKVSGNFESNVKLYATEYSKNLPTSQTVELFPLTYRDDFENGTQRFSSSLILTLNSVLLGEIVSIKNRFSRVLAIFLL